MKFVGSVGMYPDTIHTVELGESDLSQLREGLREKIRKAYRDPFACSSYTHGLQELLSGLSYIPANLPPEGEQ